MPIIPVPPDERRALGFGLLGYGFMGRAHSNALLTVRHMFWPSAVRPELVAIAGRSQERVVEAARRYGYASYTTDWHDLVDDKRVVVFDNVATDAAHVEPTLAAISRGKHVVCEKPLASNAADALRLYEAATRGRGETPGLLQLPVLPCGAPGLGAGPRRRGGRAVPGALSLLPAVAH